VLKTAPDSNEVEFDIEYLRDIEKIQDTPTDPIDLPEFALDTFYELLKMKVLVEVGDMDYRVFDAALQDNANRLRFLRPRFAGEARGAKPYWFEQDKRELYDITNQWVSQDSVTAFDSGDLIFIN
jgi:hypothetical protein